LEDDDGDPTKKKNDPVISHVAAVGQGVTVSVVLPNTLVVAASAIPVADADATTRYQNAQNAFAKAGEEHREAVLKQVHAGFNDAQKTTMITEKKTALDEARAVLVATKPPNDPQARLQEAQEVFGEALQILRNEKTSFTNDREKSRRINTAEARVTSAQGLLNQRQAEYNSWMKNASSLGVKEVDLKLKVKRILGLVQDITVRVVVTVKP
jgi:hypothetical protein